MYNIYKVLIVLILTVVPALKVQSAVLVVGENCEAFSSKRIIASISFDSDTKRLMLSTLNLDEKVSWSISMSEPLTARPISHDFKNPIRLINIDNGVESNIVFATKSSVLITTNEVKLHYLCHNYYPWQISVTN